MCLAMTAALSLSAVACGGDDSSPNEPNEPGQAAAVNKPADNTAPQSPAPAPTTTGSDAPATPAPTVTDADPETAPAPPKPGAPVIDTIKAEDTGIVLTWDKEDCDEITAERKYALQPYTVVFDSLTNVTTFIDSEIPNIPNNTTTEFTYRVRCKKDGVFSDYSDEVSHTGYEAKSIVTDPTPINPGKPIKLPNP